MEDAHYIEVLRKDFVNIEDSVKDLNSLFLILLTHGADWF